MIDKKKILICGANGVLGYAVTRIFYSQGHELHLTGIENKCPAAGEFNLPYSHLDISDKNAVKDLLREHNADIVINCAAYTSVDGCETEKELSHKINALGPLNLAQSCAEFGASLVHYSSDYLFDGESGPYKEDHSVNPINEYGKQKLEAEKHIIESTADYLILRTNVLFGQAAEPRASFLTFVVDSLKNAKDINIVEDQYNNPTWSDDLAEASAILLQENVKGIFNYGGNDYMSRLEFARMIAKVFDLNANFIHPITTASLDLPAPRPLRGGLVNDKIQNFQKIPDRKIIDILNIMKGLTQ